MLKAKLFRHHDGEETWGSSLGRTQRYNHKRVQNVQAKNIAHEDSSSCLIVVVGYHVPFMLVACTLVTIGSGLLFSLQASSSEGQLIVNFSPLLEPVSAAR